MKKLYLFLLLIFATFPAFAAPIGNPIVSQRNTIAAGSLIPTTVYNKLNGFSATTGASAGYVMIFDATAVPANGTVTPALCYEIPANTTLGASWGNIPASFTNGIVFVFSTTGCFTKTISSTAFFSVQVQ